jgi:four helix bundle protein
MKSPPPLPLRRDHTAIPLSLGDGRSASRPPRCRVAMSLCGGSAFEANLSWMLRRRLLFAALLTLAPSLIFFIRDVVDTNLPPHLSCFALGFHLTRCFPKDERFGPTSQVRRAAVSVSSNIAEGHTRQGREFAHFLSVAHGSLAEVESQLLLAVELEYLPLEKTCTALSLASEIRRMAIALTKNLN